MKDTSKIVIGLGFGDEGKGLTTSFLCSKSESPIVIRTNGGHQAGHTVVHNGHRHVFSNFGSGTMQGHPTYWSEFCVFSPIGVLNEYNALKKIKGVEPKLYVHPLCPVATPYETRYNQFTDRMNQHGSCGVGFGATLQRQEDYYKLFVQDLYNEDVLIEKLKNIQNYYAKKSSIEPQFINNVMKFDLDDFLYVVNEIKKIITVDDGFVVSKHDLIFEGAQGILLDQDFGFFPNVTRSNTTTKNPLDFRSKYAGLLMSKGQPEIYYITRAYQTRHGNGFMTNEGLFDLVLKNNELETNVTNEWQGKFRKSVLDLDLLNYSLQCDSNFSKGFKKNLVITCVDQTGDMIPVTINKKLEYVHVEELPSKLKVNFTNVYICRSDDASNMQVIHEYSKAFNTEYSF